MPKIRIQTDLIFLSCLTLMQILLVTLDIKIFIRPGIGFLYMFFVPGYLLLTIIQENKYVVYITIKWLILSLSVSLALSLVLGLISYLISPSSIREIVQVLTLGLLNLLLIGLAYIRRWRIRLRGTSNFFTFVTTLFLIITVFTMIYQPQNEASSYSLYILGKDGTISNLPFVNDRNEPVKLIVGIDYLGDSPKEFRLKSSLGDQMDIKVNPPKDTWRKAIEANFEKPGVYQLKWELLESGSTKSTRTVSLWVIVK